MRICSAHAAVSDVAAERMGYVRDNPCSKTLLRSIDQHAKTFTASASREGVELLSKR